MSDKELLKLMKEKQEDENNNYAFFGSTGLQVILDKNFPQVIGRYSPELQVAWIYPDKIYKNIRSIKEANNIT